MSRVGYIKVEKCGSCPFVEKILAYSDGGFGEDFDWHCKKKGNRKIANVEWHERDAPKEVPKWCPLR